MQRRVRGGWIGLLLLAAVGSMAVLAACGESDPPRNLRIGVLPDQSAERLEAMHQPLVDYLGEKLGVASTLVIPSDYRDLVEKFAMGEIDMAFFGGVTFILAEQDAGAVPVIMRDIDAHFTSCAIARPGAAAFFPDGYRGKRFSFGSRMSTSGHMMPRYFLKTTGIDPESFFSSVIYSAGHDATVKSVAAGDVDVGVANCSVARRMIDRGEIDREKVGIVWESEPYADYVWAAQKTMPRGFIDAIVGAATALDRNRAADSAILKALGAEALMPALMNDYDALRSVVAKNRDRLDDAAH